MGTTVGPGTRYAGSRRLLLVHAHPDDETITMGATVARSVALGDRVTLVTCTRGERGEVIPAALAHLAGDEEGLARVRAGELAAAMAALGVGDHRFLGEAAVGADGQPAPVRYRDSGMVALGGGRAGTPADLAADAFARADVDTAAALLADVLRQVRPQVLATYDPGGGYGHPDHVQAHRVAMRAVELAADPAAGPTAGPGRAGRGRPWRVAKVYWSVPARDQATTVVDAAAYLGAKVAALRAHATQVRVGEGTFALSNGVDQPLTAVECYRLVRGQLVPAPGGDLETDLFAGLR